MHKFIFGLCTILLALFVLNLAWNFFIMGIQIMIFGSKLVIFPILVIVVIYMIWHCRKFFKKMDRYK
jgi:hypothetical protein